MKKQEYPMNYEEFEKRVVELYLTKNNDVNQESFLDFIEALKNDVDGDELKALYEDSCYRYDAYGNDAFEDEKLLSQPVRLLEMVYDE